MAKVKIIKVSGCNQAFANLVPDSIHEVLYIKYGMPWVQGVGAEVPLYPDEYVWIE